jgi:hypothetical protein
VQGTAQFHDEIADARLPQAEPIFDAATALHTAVDMLDPQSAVMSGLVGRFCSGVHSWSRDFFVGMRTSTWGSMNAGWTGQAAILSGLGGLASNRGRPCLLGSRHGVDNRLDPVDS